MRRRRDDMSDSPDNGASVWDDDAGANGRGDGFGSGLGDGHQGGTRDGGGWGLGQGFGNRYGGSLYPKMELDAYDTVPKVLYFDQDYEQME